MLVVWRELCLFRIEVPHFYRWLRRVDNKEANYPSCLEVAQIFHSASGAV